MSRLTDDEWKALADGERRARKRLDGMVIERALVMLAAVVVMVGVVVGVAVIERAHGRRVPVAPCQPLNSGPGPHAPVKP